MSNLDDLKQLPLFPKPQSEQDIHKGTAIKHTVEFFQAHLRGEGKSEHTIKAFTSDLNLFTEFFKDSTPVGNFQTSDLNDFLKWLEHGRGVPCSRKSYARRVTTLKVYFKWLLSLHAIPHDPAQAILQRSGQAPLSDVLTEEQIRACLFQAKLMKNRRHEIDHRPEMLFRLLLETGIKKSEAIKLTAEDVKRRDPNNPTITVKAKVRNVFKERTLQLSGEWLNAFDLYLSQYQPKTTIFNCTARNLEYILSAIGENAELPFKLSFEIMRWTSAVNDYLKGVEEDDIRQKLGLSDVTWYETGAKIRRLANKLRDEE